jgi:hypothetical protein
MGVLVATTDSSDGCGLIVAVDVGGCGVELAVGDTVGVTVSAWVGVTYT